MVRYRTDSIREDVCQRLNRLATERGKSMNDLIEDLLNNYEGGVGGGSIVEELGEIKAILRDCLDRLGVRQSVENKPVGAESMKTEAVPAEAKSKVGGDSLFGDNPWVQILRVRYGLQNT